MSYHSLFSPALQAYRWDQLQALLHQHASPVALAGQAFLLAAWWQQPDAAAALLPADSPLITQAAADPLGHFFLAASALALGHTKTFKRWHAQPPVGQPQWMRQWLTLEWQGRSQQFTAQVQSLKRFCGKKPADFALIALLQSLDHPAADLRPLKAYLRSCPPNQAQRPLFQALYWRVFGRLPQGAQSATGPTEPHPALLLRQAASAFYHEAPAPALKLLDQQARSGLLDTPSLIRWLTLAISTPQGFAGLVARAQTALQHAPGLLPLQGLIASYLLIHAWLRGDLVQAQALVKRFSRFVTLPETDQIRPAQIFFVYIGRLCHYRQQHLADYHYRPRPAPATPSAPLPTLVALGESHALTLANLCCPWAGRPVKALSSFVMGIKMHHLAHPDQHYQARAFLTHLERIKNHPVDLLICVGEIDTRPNEGLWKQATQKHQPLDQLIHSTVSGYIHTLQQALAGHGCRSITLQGIPAPGYPLEKQYNPGDAQAFLALFAPLNHALRQAASAQGWYFLDVYSATLDQDTGQSNQDWHTDGFHLSPAFYQQAAARYWQPPQPLKPETPTTMPPNLNCP